MRTNRSTPFAQLATWGIAAALFLSSIAACSKSEPKAPTDKAAGDAKTTAAADRESTEELEPLDELPATGAKPTDVKILQKMVAAYKNATGYTDKGVLDFQLIVGGEDRSQPSDYSVVWERPNKLRMHVFAGTVVCDGKKFQGYAKDLPGEYLSRNAPAELTIASIFDDVLLSGAIFNGQSQGYSMVPIQLVLLTAKDPLKTLLHEAKTPEILEPSEIKGRKCYRIRVSRPDGAAVFWIDMKNFILRRLDLPCDEIRQGLEEAAPDRKPERFALTLLFEGAEFNPKLEPETFQFEPDPKAQAREGLVDPPMLLLGEPLPDVQFKSMDEKTVDAKALNGKTTVLEFWSTEHPPCRQSIPVVEAVRKKYLGNDKTAFHAVSVDNVKIDNRTIQARMTEMGATLPILRDPDDHTYRRLNITGLPSRWVIGPDGTLEYYETGLTPKTGEALTAVIEALLTGKKDELTKKKNADIEEERKQYLKWFKDWAAQELFVIVPQEAPRTVITPASKPRLLTLEPLWQMKDVKDPGNILVVPQGKDKPPTLAVLDGWRTVAEISHDGKKIASHTIDLKESEAVSFLRTTTDKSGKRYYAASAPAQQRVHVFDEKWKKLFSYPEGETRHAGILDVQWADLDQDGTPELYVGHFDVVGVHRVSLEGKRVWDFREIDNINKMAVLSPDAEGRHCLAAVNGTTGSIVMINAEGKRIGDFSAPKRFVTWLAAEDIDGDKKPKLCGLYMPDPTVYGSTAVGLGPKGEELWTYPLPLGVLERPVEQIVPARLSAEGPGHWLLPAADGSIHLLGSDGRAIDQFSYGKVLTGLAGFIAEGRPILVVAGFEPADETKPKNAPIKTVLEAFRVQWPKK